MTTYFIRRFLLIIPTFIGVTMIAFFITRAVPGGPLEKALMEFKMGAALEGRAATTDGGGQIPEEALDELKKAFDLDKPWYTAYFLWFKKLVTFDLGNSYRFREPVSGLIKDRLPISAYFGLLGFTLAYLICIPLGIAKALRHGTTFDFVTSATVFIGYSIPGWALGALLLVFFAGGEFYSWFPLGEFRSTTYEELPNFVQQREDQEAVGDEYGTFQWQKLSLLSKIIDQVHHTLLPVFCYMIGSFATLTVLMKNSLLENIGQDYVRTAFAKGLTPRRVIYVHTLRNSLIPIATGLGHALSVLMAGSYLIEWVFNIDGLGYLGFTSIVGRDYTVVMGILSINILLLLFGNIFSDILYAIIDPRIRFE
ncbi:MAG: ABC transporter permease subunit [Planctomycetota bacterium]|nr:ABC transporter permease subunit [Planctomycetota bacterium]